ncbi:MAG TPA: TIGR00645 family protein, partial [Bryobacteraceae bacterium]|nr:TIGR00645 family protein [Bryobacteraceae bacterium]
TRSRVDPRRGCGMAERPQGTWIERTLEGGLFSSRWLLAPFYVGLVIALAMLLVVFVREVLTSIPEVMELDAEKMILVALTLIDLSLAGNLVLIVIFSGYENFVSKIDTGDSEDRPSWMGTLDFSGLKMRLIGSMVAISAISLLRTFVSLTEPGTALDERKLFWLVALHVTFLFSGVMFALMDWLAGLTEERRIAEQHELEQLAAKPPIEIPP